MVGFSCLFLWSWWPSLYSWWSWTSLYSKWPRLLGQVLGHEINPACWDNCLTQNMVSFDPAVGSCYEIDPAWWVNCFTQNIVNFDPAVGSCYGIDPACWASCFSGSMLVAIRWEMHFSITTHWLSVGLSKLAWFSRSVKVNFFKASDFWGKTCRTLDLWKRIFCVRFLGDHMQKITFN